MKCKIIHNPRNIPTFEDFEKIEEFEYDGVLELLQKAHQPPGNICWVLDCENGKLYRSENNVFLELGIIKNTATENRKTKEITNKKYTALLRLNNNRVIEVEELEGSFSCEFIGCVPPISENDEIDETDELEQDYCCDECLLQNQTSIDDQEICKDLMLDEVISSQHLEIERLMSIVRDLVITNTKLVEIIGNSK